MHYILNEDNIVIPATLDDWVNYFETGGRVVVQSEAEVVRPDGSEYNIIVSTVFLGLDHRYEGKGAPIIFETMVFGGKLDQAEDRCSTYKQAQRMHTKMCAKVRKAYGR